MKNWGRFGKTGWLFGMLVLLSGCNRQDTEHLAKIGKILAQRSEVLLGGAEEEIIHHWKQVKERRNQNQLALQINKRLEGDKRLADCKIEVSVEGEIVELKGSVKDLGQRQRVIDLAESITGVTKVKDSLTISGSTP